MAGTVLRPQPDDAFTVSKEKDIYIVRGKRVERAVGMTDLENEEGMDRLQVTLRQDGCHESPGRGWCQCRRCRALRQSRTILGRIASC